MKDVFAPVAALLIGAAILLTGQGLQGTLLPVRAGLESFPTVAIGIIGGRIFFWFHAWLHERRRTGYARRPRARIPGDDGPGLSYSADTWTRPQPGSLGTVARGNRILFCRLVHRHRKLVERRAQPTKTAVSYFRPTS